MAQVRRQCYERRLKPKPLWRCGEFEFWGALQDDHKRHWSETAVRRTAPVLLGLFSLVTLFAHQHMAKSTGSVKQTAWYYKSHPTFSDALALVRKELWAQEQTFCGSPADTETLKIPKAFMERLTDALCYAA